MERQHGNEHPEIYCQFEDGGTSQGRHICPAYRGPLYEREIERFANVMARVRPDHTSQDIELWGWRGPIENSKRCTRCQAAFEASGLDSREQWLLAQGDRMWRDLVTAARDAIENAGGNVDFETGGYDFRPGRAYQDVWGFDRLYPEFIDYGQVSTYTPLLPDDLALIGNEVRADRKELPNSDVMPWISPGDAGTFPGEAFQWALLECFTNGARGIWFWSGRVWDAENLIAYNRVVRAIASVEELIVEGELIDDAAKVDGEGRLSGMKRGGEMVLLVADYDQSSNGRLNVTLDLPAPSTVKDLIEDGEILKKLDSGVQTFVVDLGGHRARLLHVYPTETKNDRIP